MKKSLLLLLTHSASSSVRPGIDNGRMTMERAAMPAFDLARFKRAFTGQDVAAWTDCFADDGEWIEYRHRDPPRAPHVIIHYANGRITRQVDVEAWD